MGATIGPSLLGLGLVVLRSSRGLEGNLHSSTIALNSTFSCAYPLDVFDNPPLARFDCSFGIVFDYED